MRIVVHDYSGHPFQVELSRALAARGHDVTHIYLASFQSPRGALARRQEDSETFNVRPIVLPSPIQKYSFLRRRFQEVDYGRRLAAEVRNLDPEVVLSGNTPLDAQAHLLKSCRSKGVRFVYWVQDLIGVATHRLLKRRLPVIGPAVGQFYMRLERSLLRRSDGVVLITDDFRPFMQDWGVAADRISVIENWAPLAEVPERPKENDWSREHKLADKRCLIYSGTLGMKHDPQCLATLAESFAGQPDVRVVVISEGIGAEWLRKQKEDRRLTNLILMDYQPFERVPDVLGTADVLLAVLEPDAGVFSVPSKVLTYLCAGRPLLLSVPSENLAARIVSRCEAGLLVPPGDSGSFVAAARQLLDDASLRARFGQNARAYAEEHFDITRITNRFETVLSPS